MKSYLYKQQAPNSNQRQPVPGLKVTSTLMAGTKNASSAVRHSTMYMIFSNFIEMSLAFFAL